MEQSAVQQIRDAYLPTQPRELYHRHALRKLLVLALLAGALILAALAAIAVGAAGIAISDVCRILINKLVPGTYAVQGSQEYIVWNLRLPRILLAILTGMALAGAGAVMQGVLRNPLASPFTLGVSSGAAFGAALAIVLGASVFGVKLHLSGQYLIMVNAFVFGCLSVLFVYAIARLRGGVSETLLLGGVAISYLFSAGVSALKYVSNHEALRDLVMWLMGGLWGAKWSTVGLLAPVVVGCLLLIFRYAWDLNTIGSGEEVASTLGVNVQRVRTVSLITVTLAASATICFTGIIGFIGLVAPHLSRMLIGVDNRYLIPCSCLMGALILLLADTLARTLMAPAEIPVGILTSLLGAPFFIFMLIKKKRTIWS